MLGRYSTLADHFVKLPGAPERSREQVIELLRERVMPIDPARAQQSLRSAA